MINQKLKEIEEMNKLNENLNKEINDIKQEVNNLFNNLYIVYKKIKYLFIIENKLILYINIRI